MPKPKLKYLEHRPQRDEATVLAIEVYLLRLNDWGQRFREFVLEGKDTDVQADLATMREEVAALLYLIESLEDEIANSS